MQIEIFKTDNHSGLQREVNGWLRRKEGDIEIIHMVQSECPPSDRDAKGSVTLTFLYNTKPPVGALAAIKKGIRPKSATNEEGEELAPF